MDSFSKQTLRYDALKNGNEKLQKIIACCLLFKTSDYKLSINEISLITGISSSSVQRYLNEDKVIKDYFGEETCLTFKEQLSRKKLEGNSKGGTTSQGGYRPTRDPLTGQFSGSVSIKNGYIKNPITGRFEGSVYPTSENVLNEKISIVDKIVRAYLSVDNISLSQLSKVLNINESYIYNCLKSKYVEFLFGKEVADDIANRLSNNKPVNMNKLK